MEKVIHIISGGLHILAAITWIGSMIYNQFAVTPALNTLLGSTKTYAVDGKIIKKNLLDARITIDNLLGQLRIKNIFSLSEVELAIVEPSGKINVIKKASGLPVTRKQMKLPLKNVSLPTVLVYDGKVQNENLKVLGHDLNWLDDKIKTKGVLQIKDIFLAVLEGDGTLYVSV